MGKIIHLRGKIWSQITRIEYGKLIDEGMNAGMFTDNYGEKTYFKEIIIEKLS